MKKVTWKGGALIAPVPPAMVSLKTNNGKGNIITVAWTGITNTMPPKTYISVRPSRYSYDFIMQNREFVINLTTEELAKTADLCGIYTGKKIDKFKKYGLTPIPATKIDCPMIAESPMSFECKVTDVIPLGSHTMFLADILCVNVDENLIDKDGKLCLDKAKLCAFAHGEYYSLGRKIGNFGFSVAGKRKKSDVKTNLKHK